MALGHVCVTQAGFNRLVQAVDAILPPMLADLENEDIAATVLDGLRQLMGARSEVRFFFFSCFMAGGLVSIFQLCAGRGYVVVDSLLLNRVAFLPVGWLPYLSLVQVVLPFLVPQLTEQPMSAFNARALASLAAVAGEALNECGPSDLARRGS